MLPCLTRLTEFYEFDTTVKDTREKVCACCGTVSFYCNPPIVLKVIIHSHWSHNYIGDMEAKLIVTEKHHKFSICWV